MGDDCSYCLKKHMFCGIKIRKKDECLNRNDQSWMNSIYESVFIEFQTKILEFHHPSVGEVALLNVLKKRIEQKKEDLKLKGRPTVEYSTVNPAKRVIEGNTTDPENLRAATEVVMLVFHFSEEEGITLLVKIPGYI